MLQYHVVWQCLLHCIVVCNALSRDLAREEIKNLNIYIHNVNELQEEEALLNGRGEFLSLCNGDSKLGVVLFKFPRTDILPRHDNWPLSSIPYLGTIIDKMALLYYIFMTIVTTVVFHSSWMNVNVVISHLWK